MNKKIEINRDDEKNKRNLNEILEEIKKQKIKINITHIIEIINGIHFFDISIKEQVQKVKNEIKKQMKINNLFYYYIKFYNISEEKLKNDLDKILNEFYEESERALHHDYKEILDLKNRISNKSTYHFLVKFVCEEEKDERIFLEHIKEIQKMRDYI